LAEIATIKAIFRFNALMIKMITIMVIPRAEN